MANFKNEKAWRNSEKKSEWQDRKGHTAEWDDHEGLTAKDKDPWWSGEDPRRANKGSGAQASTWRGREHSRSRTREREPVRSRSERSDSRRSQPRAAPRRSEKSQADAPPP